MTILAGLFLIAHGFVHIPVWVATPRPDQPFDPRKSWLLGDVTGPARAAGIVACALFVVAGILVLLGAGAGPPVAIAGAAVSLALALVTFNRWLSFAVAINVAIVVLALRAV